MNILDLNSNQKETILLIHPMLSSAQGMKSLIADQMGQEFRYIIPDLSAHGQSASTIYESALKESQMIYEYLKDHHIKDLRLAFGASLDRPNTRLISDGDSILSISYSGIGQSNVAAN